MSNGLPISTIIITYNEENNIGDCLESVKWCDEIVLVDAFSSDKTVAIAEKYTDIIIQRKWTGFSDQKAFALEKATNEWVLSIDADERCTPELQDEIQKAFGKNKNGYYIPRKSYFLGKWMKHSGWYPGYQVRFFLKAKTTVSEKKVHEGFLVDGEIGYLQNPIIHYTHPSIEDSLQKMNLYSSLESEDRNQIKKVHWYDILSHPFAAFLRKYFAQKGFLDGMPGFILAIITAQLKMALYMKLWERQQKNV